MSYGQPGALIIPGQQGVVGVQLFCVRTDAVLQQYFFIDKVLVQYNGIFAMLELRLFLTDIELRLCLTVVAS